MGLVVGENYVWRHVIMVTFWGLSSKEVGGRFKVIFRGDNASHKEGEQFLWGRGFSLCNTTVLKLCYKFY